MAEDRKGSPISGEGLDVLRGLAADDRRLSASERTMLALAIAELEQRRQTSPRGDRPR
jgi:hypothetical protein